MIVAALDLLRNSGLAGAGLNQIVSASKAPKGSIYHFFPDGKYQLVAEALAQAERAVGDAMREIFARRMSTSQKVKVLFAETGDHLSESGYKRGCPIAAVTLDLDEASEELRSHCSRIFHTWVGAIADGLAEVPSKDRLQVAELILSTLEGALILSRAYGTLDPVRRGGKSISEYLALKYPGVRT